MGSRSQCNMQSLETGRMEVKALQPAQPVAGHGSMWILQSVVAPPQLIFHMAHGEVVVSKHRQNDTAPKMVSTPSVGSASTLTLCSAGHAGGEVDPWTASDPGVGTTSTRMDQPLHLLVKDCSNWKRGFPQLSWRRCLNRWRWTMFQNACPRWNLRSSS